MPTLACMVLALLLASTARAEPELVRLAPTAESVARERSARLEARITRLVRALPAVERVEVSVTLPVVSEVPLDEQVPPPHVSVVVTRSAIPFPRDEVFALIHGELPGLTRRDLTLVEHTQQSSNTRAVAPRNVSVGPFVVAPESATRLRVALAVSLAIHALFAVIVLWRLREARLGARKVDPRARMPSPP